MSCDISCYNFRVMVVFMLMKLLEMVKYVLQKHNNKIEESNYFTNS